MEPRFNRRASQPSVGAAPLLRRISDNRFGRQAAVPKLAAALALLELLEVQPAKISQPGGVF